MNRATANYANGDNMEEGRETHRRPNAKSPRDRSASATEAGLIQSISQLINELALPLLRAGVTPKRIADIAAEAFVTAACSASTMRNGRVNQSRVAVLTGLSRVEVRRLMANKPISTPGKQSRTARVIDGWISDRRYVASDGRPRLLKVQGRGNTFVSLVKDFAGDVPYRAVLDELRRMKIVREQDSHVQLLESRDRGRSRLERRLEAILPLVADSVGVAVEEGGSAIPMRLFRLTLEVTDQRALAVIQERADSSAKAWLSGLRESLSDTGLSRRKAGRVGRRVTVSVLVRKQDMAPNTKRY